MPFVVVAGPPNSRIVDVCVSPRELVESRGALLLSTEFYIQSHVAPALQRVLGLAGADVHGWCAGTGVLTKLQHCSAPPSLLVCASADRGMLAARLPSTFDAR